MTKAYVLAAVCASALGAAVAIGASQSLGFALLVVAGAVGIFAAAALITRRDFFSVYGLIAAFYLLSFTVGAVYFHNDFQAALDQGFWFTTDGLLTALGIGLVGFAFLSLGYVANPLARPRRWLPSCPTLSPEAPLVTVVLLLMAAGWAARAVQIAKGQYFHTAVGETASTGATFLINTVSSVPTLAAALLGAAVYLRGDTRAWKAAFWALLAIEAIWYLPSGERAKVVGIALAAVIVMYYARGGRLPWRSFAVGSLVLIFLVFPFVNAYRGQWGQDWSYQEDPGRGVQEGVKALTGQSPHETLELGLKTTFSRFSDVASVGTLVSKGRDLSPREPGETLSWIPETALPRALVPDKEDPGAFGNEFGRAYAILVSFNVTTAIAISQPGELFMNFGWLGLMIGMAVLGAVYRALNDYLAGRWTDPVPLALYSISALPLINGLESIVAVGLMGLLKTLVVMMVLVWAANGVAVLLTRRVGLVPSSA